MRRLTEVNGQVLTVGPLVEDEVLAAATDGSDMMVVRALHYPISPLVLDEDSDEYDQDIAELERSPNPDDNKIYEWSVAYGSEPSWFNDGFQHGYYAASSAGVALAEALAMWQKNDEEPRTWLPLTPAEYAVHPLTVNRRTDYRTTKETR